LSAPAEAGGHTVLNGRYVLGGLIAEGGMAQVFRGHDRRLDRAVAVKVLRPHYAASAEALARFAREARLAAALTHPHLMQVFDVGQDGHRHYIVLELLPGRTLKDLLAGGPRPLDEAVVLAQQIALGMAAAHQRGLVHRDLKPQNVLLTEDGSAKVGDFGLAQAADAPHLTLPGTVWGTVHYLSPEQAQGFPADARSDIYALGVICYELFTGVPPYQGESPAAILHQHVYAPVPRVRDRNPLLPVAAEAVVARAMAKAPEERFQSMAALAEALGALRTTGAAGASAALPMRRPGARSGATAGSVVPIGPQDRTQAIWPSASSVSSSAASASPSRLPERRPPALVPPRTGGHGAVRRRTPALLATAILACFAIMAVGSLLLTRWMPAPLVAPSLLTARSTPASSATAPPVPASAGVPATTGTSSAATPGAPGSAVPTPSSPASAATPLSTPLTLGTFARVGGWSVAVSRYEWSATCPGGRGRLAPGTKFVMLQITGRNDLPTPLLVPAMQWSLAGQPASASTPLPCQSDAQDEQVTPVACLPAGTLAAGARCASRLVFEVPAALDVPGAIVQVRAPGGASPETASWRLPA
jgi:serine/threonine-protein kinase